jgi:TatD DNase family protein
MELIDTHCHLTFKGLRESCTDVIRRAARAGVSRLITVACTPGELEAAYRVSVNHENVYMAAGIHPHNAAAVGGDAVALLQKYWQYPEAVAGGEMGLDYHYDFSPRQRQQDVFRQQLELLRPGDLPAIIHSREAFEDTVRILQEEGYENRPVVFHCFSGTAEQAAELRSHGWWTSFTGVVTFKNAKTVQQACAETPLDQLMFETDAPYLSPEPVRKHRPNEPANLRHVLHFVAQLRGESPEQVAKATTSNALSFFRINQQNV